MFVACFLAIGILKHGPVAFRRYGRNPVLPTHVGTSGQLVNMKKCSVYILRSLKNGTFYIGCASDVTLRLKQHNCGNVTATKYKRPYRLEFSQEYPDTSVARKTESRLKKWKRRDFIENIIRDGFIRGL